MALSVLAGCGGGGGGAADASSSAAVSPAAAGTVVAVASPAPVAAAASAVTTPVGAAPVVATPVVTPVVTPVTTTVVIAPVVTAPVVATPVVGAPTTLVAANLAVLIAAGDANSEAIGLAYQQARGIPEANMIRVPVPAGADVISSTDFATLKAAIDARLPAGTQATLVTWTQPSRVLGSCSMGITSALAFGYSAGYCGQCSSTLASAYFASSSRLPWTDLRIRPSMMLGAATLADAQALIARGLAADGVLTPGSAANLAANRPTGQAWLLRTTDTARSKRYPDFKALAATTVPGLAMNYVDNSDGTRSDLVTSQSNVMFYFTGLAVVAQAASNHYLPGAAADHLTSYGGVLPDGYGQTPATAWLAAGATASFGTVEEPCNYTQKFPAASVLVDRYRRGETLIEAYWKSVQWPGQGLFVGEPLARPWGS